MRRLVRIVGSLALFGSGSYVFVYLYRWERHRAIVVALLFVAAGVAMASAAILRRLPSSGGGVVVSAVTWVVEKVAGRTAEPARRRLAVDLEAIAFPPDGLLPRDPAPLAEDQPLGDDDEDFRLLLGRTGRPA
ncbi:MAG TPA: hypothetical protein VHE80_00270 [Acidimicrobiales bacterium]|nr:hypothetical protein [Acidimicrobiales bacterium]